MSELVSGFERPCGSQSLLDEEHDLSTPHIRQLCSVRFDRVKNASLPSASCRPLLISSPAFFSESKIA